MQWLPQKDNNGPLAIGLLVIALILVYLVCFHWFVSAQVSVGRDIGLLKDQVGRFKTAIDRRGDLEARLTRLTEAQLDSALFLDQSSLSLSAAELTRTLRAYVRSEAQHGDLCRVLATENRAPPEDEPFEQVTVNVRMTCPLDDLVKIIYALEQNTPMVFVDQLIIQQRGGRTRRGMRVDQALEVRFDMFGFRGERREVSVD